MHWPRIHGLCSVSWCLAEGQWNGDQRRPMGRKARERLYSYSLYYVKRRNYEPAAGDLVRSSEVTGESTDTEGRLCSLWPCILLTNALEYIQHNIKIP